MATRYKYFKTSVDPETGKVMKTIRTIDYNNWQNDDDISYKIPINHQYRPDKIAKYFYGDKSYKFVILWANKVKDSPQYFTTGKIIRIPNPQRILK